MLEAPRNHLGEEFKPEHFWGPRFSENTAEGSLVGGLSAPLPEAQATKAGRRGLPLPAVSSNVCPGDASICLCTSAMALSTSGGKR